MSRLLRCILVCTTSCICADAAAVLLSLLKELQKQSQAINHLAGISSQWCSDAAHQDLGMMQVTQGQLDDATIAVQQIQSDEKRLQSELTLAKATQQQREQQLKDATSTSNFATAEFASEQDQLSKSLEACKHGIRLVKAQMQMDTEQQGELAGADVAVGSLLQTSTGRVTDDEKTVMTQYASDPKPVQGGATGAKPQQLLQTLTKLHTRLAKEQSQAFSEQQVLSLRLWSFTDHLTSSIMESKSQAASIGMEIAQRKRERSRLGGKISALSALRSKVETSKQAVASSCSLDVDTTKEVEKYIEEESGAVHTTLKRMPALSSELLFDLSSVLPAAPTFPSFLQVGGRKSQHKAAMKLRNAVDPILKDLDSMASKFPDDSSSFVDAEHQLAAHRSKPEPIADPSQAQKGIKGFATSSIQDIYAFLKSDDTAGGTQLPGEERMLLVNSGDLKSVTDVYQGLLDHVHTKEKVVDDQLKWCGSIARDAKVDADAVARSLKWTGAKLNLVRVAMSEYERTVDFNKQQQTKIASRSSQLEELASTEDSQLQRSYESLKQFGQQLLSLASELAQKTSADEHKGAAAVKMLLDKIEKHQGLLQRWRVQSTERRQAVTSAFHVVGRALADGAKQGGRRLVQLKVEAQGLASMASSKTKDEELSAKYMKLSKELCSMNQAKDLQAKGASLRTEATAVQKRLSTLSQPTA